MQTVDWTGAATLYERDDSGSDMDIVFHRRAQGALGDVIAQVLALNGAERARMIIDRGADGMLNIHDIVALAAHDDFPGNKG